MGVTTVTTCCGSSRGVSCIASVAAGAAIAAGAFTAESGTAETADAGASGSGAAGRESTVACLVAATERIAATGITACCGTPVGDPAVRRAAKR
jgi:hypothetical protein